MGSADAEPGTPVAGVSEPRRVDAPVADSVEHLSAVYRDFPGIRAVILRRIRDPELAADLLQDAAVTTLEKLRAGNIAQPHRIGGFLVGVALNHLKNFRRKDRAGLASSAALESVPDERQQPAAAQIDSVTWARLVQEVLRELPTPRDRELLVRFYLDDEPKEDICRALTLSEKHFHRVIFRARNRFRELLEQRGIKEIDLLSWAALFSAAILYALLAASYRVAL